jgi:glutamate/tyrosine decarboxylase-like PLP-dependent enzyme/putative methionine-R-sulfoxide reductase with GAF domain
MSAPGAWGWDEAALRAHGERALGLALDHMAGVRDRPVFAPVAAATARRLREEPWAEDGCPSDRLLGEVAETVLPHPFGNGHPRFHGWVNPPPDRAAVLAALIAAAMNPSCAGGEQAALHVEGQVIRWLAEMLGMPEESGGLLTSGGSLATLTALAAARHAHAGFDVRELGLAGGPPLNVLATAEAHSCVTKAVELLGIGRRNLRLVATDAAGRMDPGALDGMLAAGHGRPVAVVASAGSASTGVVDPLAEIADVCERHGVWLHVDGSYGAPAVLAPAVRPLLRGIERADSVALDPHKWLYVPVDAGALLVRRPQALREAFTLVPPYLTVADEAPWLSEYGPEQTRPFRALRVWAAMKATGRAGYRALIEHDLALAARLADAVAADDRLELVSRGLSIVCFRVRAGSDALQSDVARRIQLGGEAFLATTVAGGRTCLRACVINPLTTEADVDELVRLVCRTAVEIALVEEVRGIAGLDLPAPERARRAAGAIRAATGHRWVGVYAVRGAEVVNLGWSGPGPPAHPAFAVGAGLTGAAIATRAPVACNDVASDPRYLEALGTTASELIGPVLRDGAVVGTLDVESERPGAFTTADAALAERLAGALAELF